MDQLPKNVKFEAELQSLDDEDTDNGDGDEEADPSIHLQHHS